MEAKKSGVRCWSIARIEDRTRAFTAADTGQAGVRAPC